MRINSESNTCSKFRSAAGFPPYWLEMPGHQGVPNDGRSLPECSFWREGSLETCWSRGECSKGSGIPLNSRIEQHPDGILMASFGSHDSLFLQVLVYRSICSSEWTNRCSNTVFRRNHDQISRILKLNLGFQEIVIISEKMVTFVWRHPQTSHMPGNVSHAK